MALNARVFGRGGLAGGERALDRLVFRGVTGSCVAGAEAEVGVVTEAETEAAVDAAEAAMTDGGGVIKTGSVTEAGDPDGPSVGELSSASGAGSDAVPFCRGGGGKGSGAVGALCKITTLGMTSLSLLLTAPETVRRGTCSSGTAPRPVSTLRSMFPPGTVPLRIRRTGGPFALPPAPSP